MLHPLQLLLGGKSGGQMASNNGHLRGTNPQHHSASTCGHPRTAPSHNAASTASSRLNLCLLGLSLLLSLHLPLKNKLPLFLQIL